MPQQDELFLTISSRDPVDPATGRTVGPVFPKAPPYDPLLAPYGQVDPLQQNLRQTKPDPQKARRILEMQVKTGLAPGLIEPQLEQLEKLHRQNALDPDHLRAVSPAIAAWLSETPVNAQATSPKEVQKLQRVEAYVGWGSSVLRGIDQMQGSFYGSAYAFGEALGFDPLAEFGRQGMERNRLEALAYGDAPKLASAFTSVTDFGNYVSQTLGENLPNMGVSMAGGLGGAWTGAQAGFALGAFAGGPAAPVTGPMGATLGATIGGFLGAFLPSAAMGIGDVQGEIKDLSPGTKAPWTAILAGTAVGFFDSELPGHLGSKLVRTFGKETAEQMARRILLEPLKPRFLRRTATGLVTGMSTEALTEGLQEAIQAYAAGEATGTPVQWTDLQQRVLEAAVAGGLVGGVTAGSFEGVTTRREQARWEKATVAANQQAAFFKALGQAAQDSDLIQTLPESMRGVVAEMTKDGPLTQVFIPVAQWEEYWQQRGESPALAAEAVTGRADALAEAKAERTGLLAVDLADYTTKLAANPDHNAFFQNEVKLRPDLANRRETVAAIERSQRLFEETQAKQAAETAEARDVIADGLATQWVERGASRYMASRWASYWAQHYVQRARVRGENPLQVYQRDPLGVFYSLASGEPLVPLPPQDAAAVEAQATAQAVQRAIPDSALTEAREQTLTAAFQALGPEGQAPDVLALDQVGFTPEEVQGLTTAGLAADGRMTREQFVEYLRTRAERDKQQRVEAAGVLDVGDLPASFAPAEETPQERDRRRGLHLAALTAVLERTAQALDPTVTREQLRAELERRLAYDEERREAIQTSGRGQALLRAIASYGGIWFNEQTKGERGEVLFYARESRDVKDTRERGGRSAAAYDAKEWEDLRTGRETRGVQATWNGIAGVFRKDGLTPDEMATHLRQEGEFGNIEGADDLFNAIDDALRAEREIDAFPGTREVQRLGVDPTTRWWESGWGVDPQVFEEEREFERDELDDVDADEDRTFAQRARRGTLPHGATVAVMEDGVEIHLPGGAFISLTEGTGPPDYLDIANVFVPPDQRRQGKGRQLYEAAVAYALSRGQEGLSSLPVARNEASDGLWRALAREGVVTQVDGYDVVTYTGGDFFQRPTEPAALPREFWQRPGPKPIPPSVDAQTGLPGVMQAVAAHLAKTGASLDVPDLSDIIEAHVHQAFARAGLGERSLDVSDPRVQDYLVRVLTAETAAALEAHPQAVGWYETKVPQARELVGLVHPEVLTDDNAWFVFTYLLAVLSNGVPVKDNFNVSAKAYQQFTQTGKIPTTLGRGKPKAQVDKALEFFNQQVFERGGATGGGVQAFREMLLQRHRVGDLRKVDGFKAVAGLVDEQVFAAAVLGPKIGNGFLLNLQGVFSQLTFDRWWARTWGRLTGSLDTSNPVLAAKNRVDLRAALAALTANERLVLESLVGPQPARYTNAALDALAYEIKKIAAQTGKRGEMLKAANVGLPLDRVRRLANTLTENIRSYRETPFNDGERAIMDAVARRALANVQAVGYPDLTPADFQAALWYPEKRLYEAAKDASEAVGAYANDEAPDYANAARDYARAHGAGDGAITGALVRGERRAAAARRAAPAGLAARGEQPAGRRAGAVRRRQAVSAARGVDPGEFFQTSGVASSTLAAFYSRLTLPVRDAKVSTAKGRDWKAIIQAAKTGIHLDEYAAVGVEGLDDATTYTRDEVLAFLKAHEVQVEVVELASPDELIDPEVLQREIDRLYEEQVRGELRILMATRGVETPIDEASVEVVPVETDGGTVYTVFVAGDSFGEFPSEAQARTAVDEWLTDENSRRRRLLRRQAEESVNTGWVEERAHESVREQYLDRQAHYSEYVISGAVEGTYREVFLTAPSAGEGVLLREQRRVVEEAIRAVEERVVAEQGTEFADEPSGLDALRKLLASDDFVTLRGEDFRALTADENEVVRNSTPGLALDLARAVMRNLPTNWKDGHDAYNNIRNPIVRLRYNVRRVGTEQVLFLEEVQPPVKEEFAKLPPLFQKQWRALAMRYALQHAAVMGHDRVAWTSGEMQVRRWPGVQQEAAWINYMASGERLTLVDADGQVLLEKSGVKPSDLPRFLGEETAARLLSSEPRPANGQPFYQIPGAGKRVGGEGLMRLYDQDLVAITNKLPVMRQTGTKVTRMDLPNMAQQWVYVGPTFTVAELRARAETLPAWLRPAAVSIAEQMTAGLSFAEAVRDEVLARGGSRMETVVGGRMELRDAPATVPGVVVSPTLREALRTRGQEFFQGGPRPFANEPYQQTFFGERIAPVDPLAPSLPTRVEMVTTGTRTLPAQTVQTSHDAAAALGYLSRGAQERVDGLVVDEAGRPLALIGGFKGSTAEAPVYHEVLLAEALNVPGATAVWLAHNHPSGDPRLSNADREMLRRVQGTFRDSGIQVQGLLAIGAGFGPERRYEFTATGEDTTPGPVRAPEPGVTVPVPTQEREYVAHETLHQRAMTTPATAAAVASVIAGDRFGIVLVDTKNVARGFIPLDPETALALKDEGRARALYQTWAQSGTTRAFVFTPDVTAEGGFRARNVAEALHAIGVEVIDVVHPEGTAGLTRTMLTGNFLQEEGGGPPGVRGGYNRSHNWIRLVADAENLSTFLHESGHAFLHWMMVDALEFSLQEPGTLTDLQQRHLRDATTVLQWFNFGGTVGDFLALSTDEQRAMHEQWARAFEVYLMTGEAPSAELRPIFATFRAWLLQTYNRYFRKGGALDQAAAEAAVSRDAGFPVSLPQEIREVMDRLHATDEAIAAVRAEREVVPLFTDPATAGVDPLTYAAYRDLIEEANIKARETLDAKLLKEWRQAQQVEWQREREGVESQVVQELNTNPVVVALSVIRTGKLPTGDIPWFGDGRPLKLSKTAIVQMKGAAFLATLPRPYLYTVTGGIHPDDLAPQMGFSSGDALLDALVKAPNPRQAAQVETDKRMRERHGDQLLDGLDLKDLAEQALHEHRGDVVAAELQALTQGLAANIPSRAALKAAAEARVARLQVRELQPGMFLQAATRASQRAFDAFARNDRAAAVQHKIDELSTLALYRAASEAKARAQANASALQAWQDSPGRRRRLFKAGADYLEQIDALLEKYEFTKVSQRLQDRRLSLRKFVEQQQALGLPVTIPDWMIDDARTINYTRLSTEELEGLRQAVEHIAHLARLKTKLLDAREQADLATIQSTVAASIYALNTTRELPREPRLGAERIRHFSAGVAYSHRKLASIVRQLDGFTDGGPMWHFVMRRLNEAANREASMNGSAELAIMALFKKHYTPRERGRMSVLRATPELNVSGESPASYSKQALLLMALNQGNDQNRQRLRDGYRWTQDQVDQALAGHLDQRDWQFVQDVLDYIESYWPAIMEKTQRVAGAVPEKVDATPILTRFGIFRGGYFPITWEGQLSGRNMSLELGTGAKLAESAAYVHATTRRGHLERRAEGDVRKRPVRLDFGVITQHLGQVIHDLTHHEVLLDVNRVLDADAEVAEAIIQTLGPQAFEQFRTGLRDIALGDVGARHETEGLLGYLRNGATVVGLGWNLTTSLLQPLGYAQSIQRIGWRWAGHGLMSFFRGALPMQQGTAAIVQQSEFMRNRFSNLSPELRDVRERVGITSGRLVPWMDVALRSVTNDRLTKVAIADSYFAAIAAMQKLVDIPTYLGARAKAMADPANLRPDGSVDEEKVIALAEQAVIDSQGAGQMKDLAAVQRGGPAWKLWINFYSFFNVTYQALAESVARNGGRFGLPTNPVAVGRLAVDWLLLITAPTVASHLLRSAIVGTLGDEADDPEALAWALIREQLSYLANTMVLLREFGNYIEGRYASYAGPAGARGIPSLGRFISEAQKEIEAGEWDTALVENAWKAGGVLFHFPAAQIERTAKGIQSIINGETENPAEALSAVAFGPPPE